MGLIEGGDIRAGDVERKCGAATGQMLSVLGLTSPSGLTEKVLPADWLSSVTTKQYLHQGALLHILSI
jgi:hypothetical protein